MRRKVRLTESDLHRIIARVINEVTLPNGSEVNRGVLKTPSGRKFSLNKESINRIVRESIKRVLREGKLPSYDEPVFIECTSPEDADASVEIGYSDYSSSLFYVGECGTDGYAAVAAVVQWLEENGLIDHYAYSEEDLDAYHPDDIIDVEGYYFPSWEIHVNQLCDNHGGRR